MLCGLWTTCLSHTNQSLFLFCLLIRYDGSPVNLVVWRKSVLSRELKGKTDYQRQRRRHTYIMHLYGASLAEYFYPKCHTLLIMEWCSFLPLSSYLFSVNYFSLCILMYYHWQMSNHPDTRFQRNATRINSHLGFGFGLLLSPRLPFAHEEGCSLAKRRVE